MSETSGRVRFDKWLWAARFYKTRGLAAQAIEAGHARLNDSRVKTAKEVRAGDTVAVRAGELEWIVEVLALAEKRGPANVAALLYRESAESRDRRELMLAVRRAGPRPDPDARGRPTKRDRRLIRRFTEG